MRILVTGSHGFVGSHLVERLLKEGHQVIGIDDFSMGKLENVASHENLITVMASIIDDISEYFEDVDLVYHLAALTRPQESISNPIKFNEINVEGTMRILRHCIDKAVPHIVFMSSTSLYGTQNILPTPETVTPYPMSPYGLQKLIGEQYCELYERMYGLKINKIRPFNVYGTRQDPNGGYAAAIPKFIDLLSRDMTPYITGDGSQSRDFIYVEDLVDLLIKAGTGEVWGEAFNAGSGVSTSINDLYKMICKIMGKNTKPNYVAPVFEPPKTLGDISKAMDLLGWSPKHTLKDGLTKMVKEMRL